MLKQTTRIHKLKLETRNINLKVEGKNWRTRISIMYIIIENLKLGSWTQIIASERVLVEWI